MQSFATFVSQNVPWLWPLLAWALAVVAVLIVAAAPAYLVVYPLISNLRRVIGSYISALVTRHSSARQQRRSSNDALVEELRSSSGLSFLPAGNGQLQAALASFSETAKTIQARTETVQRVPEAFSQIAARLKDALRSSPAFPDVPTSAQIAGEQGALRTATMRLIVTSLFLVALISVNTGMLGQILRDLGFIPHDLSYFGIPLYLVFAFILTLIEAGLGVLHTASRPEEPGRVAVWPAIAVVLALIIASVEGFFYSQVAPIDKKVFALPGGFEIRPESLFFLWGFALVVALFGLGMVWDTSLERLTRSSGGFQAFAKKLVRHEKRYAKACETSASEAGQLKRSLDGVSPALRSAAEQTNAIAESVERLNQAVADNRPDVTTPTPLSSGEARQFGFMAGIWFTLTIIASIVVSIATFFALGYRFRSLGPAGYLAIAVGVAASFVVLGILFPRGELLLDGTGARRMIVSGSMWRSRTAVVLTVVFLLTFITLVWQSRGVKQQAALWLLITIIGGGLAAAASQTTAMGKGLRFWFHTCAAVVAAAFEFGGRLIVRIIFAAAYLLEIVSLAFAAPIYLLRGRQLPSLHVAPDAPQHIRVAQSVS